jgi:multiple sugar transport system substrate-binding protein
MNGTGRLVGLVSVLALVVGACTGGGEAEQEAATPGESPEPVTITVWDYYGSATPIEPAIESFEQEYPWITVKHEAISWDAAHEKFTVVVSGGNPPDVATMDMTWIPTFGSNGLFADLKEISGGQLNGEPIEDQYTEGALGAMTLEDQYVTMLFDFDAYALYYRADQFEEKGIEVPGTWDELLSAAEQLAEDTDGDGEKDKYLYGIASADCFHWCQFLFQAGGSILNEEGTAAAFNSQAGLDAFQMYLDLRDSGNGIYWTPDLGDDFTPGIKDETIGMFQDGPYYMGLLKDAAPEQEGLWQVAPAPRQAEPGSYLGGTGLSIPVNAEHPEEAWLFIQYMLRLEQQVGVFEFAGAAPATSEALGTPELTETDAYFGGQAPFPIFLDTMATATHFPYVEQWDQIDVIIGEMVDAVMVGDKSPQEALDDAAAEVNQELSG